MNATFGTLWKKKDTQRQKENDTCMSNEDYTEMPK
jgi:hypothetical protein